MIEFQIFKEDTPLSGSLPYILFYTYTIPTGLKAVRYPRSRTEVVGVVEVAELFGVVPKNWGQSVGFLLGSE